MTAPDNALPDPVRSFKCSHPGFGLKRAQKAVKAGMKRCQRFTQDHHIIAKGFGSGSGFCSKERITANRTEEGVSTNTADQLSSVNLAHVLLPCMTEALARNSLDGN